MIKIFYNSTYIEVQPDDNSYVTSQIMGADELYLSFQHTGFLDIPVGAYVVFAGVTYYLLKPENFTKNGTRKYAYELTLQADSGRLNLYKFKNTTDGRLKFDMTAKPHEFITMLVANINSRNSGWTVGNVMQSDEKLISFNHNSLAEVLDTIAKTFETEWYIRGKEIHLGKMQFNADAPLELSYGKGNGFVPGLGRSNYDNSQAFDILYVQGGERNIDFSTYGNKTLLLPKSQTIRYDGQHFEGETGFVQSKSRLYQTDAAGISIRRADKQLSDLAPEDSYDNDEAYPKRVGTVSAVQCVDADNNFWDFYDSSIPAALDYEQYLIAGDEGMTVVFQTGMLAGREFDVKYFHDQRKFEIVPQELDGMIMPNDSFKPVVGDTYIIYGCTLPDAYICDNSSKTGASWDLFKEAVRYMFENEESRFTFNGVLDGRWAAANWDAISPKLILGGTIRFSDTQFLVTPEDIRIVGLKTYINKPKYPELTISNTTITSSIVTELNGYKGEEVIRESRYQQSLSFSKRRWRDLKETQEMLEAAFENFSGSIDPVSVATMQMIVGDESLQFRFVTSKTAPIYADDGFTLGFDGTTKQVSIHGGLTAGASLLQHLTIGISNISSSHDASEYHFWDIPAFVSSNLTDPDKKYYVYAKVPKNGSNGVFLLSETPIAMEAVTGYYHLLLGFLNSEYEGARSFAQMYGYTEVLPGRITTDKIASSDGINYFDLVNGYWNMSTPNGSQYVRLNQNGLQINAKVTIGSGSSGLGEFAEYPDLIAQIQNRTPYNILLTNENACVACSADGTPIGAMPTSGIQVYYGATLQSGWSFSLNCVGCSATVVNGTIIVSAVTADNATITVTATKTDCPTLTTTMNIIKVRGGGAGKGVSSIVEQYYLSDSATTQTGGSWGTTVPTWVDGKYIWTRSVITYTDSTSTTTDPVCVTGGKGETGDDGVGIASVDVEYYLSDSATSLTGGSWSTTAPTWVDGKYMWSRTHTTYTDGNDDYSDPACITGAKGETGVQGPAGADGRTSYFHIKYSPVANPTAAQMTETPSDYIGTYVDYNAVDSSDPSAYTWARFKGIQGEQGEQGIPGTDGEDGTTYYLHIAYATSADGTQGFSPTVSEGKTYIGQYVDTEPLDSNVPSDYSWSKIKGDDAVLYYVQPSVSIVKRSWDGTVLPDSVTCKVYKIVGNATPVESSDVDLYYQLSEGQEMAYTGAVNVIAGCEYIDFRIKSGTTVLDSQRVPVLNDASELDLEAIEQAIENLQDSAAATQQILDDMNSDTVFDTTEKQYIRTLWETINGASSLNRIGATGSYMQTLDIVQRSGYVTGETVKLAFNNSVLVFNNNLLTFNYTGLDKFNTAFLNLRAYLAEMELYSDVFTKGFDREVMSEKFTAYYDAQEELLNNAQFHYADTAAQSSVQAFINGAYKNDMDALKESMDKKAETHVQATDPSLSWSATEKEHHLSDIWWNTSSQEVAGVSAGATAVYHYNELTSTYYWEETPVPKEVFDQIDGKSALYVAIPNTPGVDGYCYHKRDMWVLESGLQQYPTDCVAGDLVIATQSSQTYNVAHWQKYLRYTDDTAFNNFYTNTYLPYVDSIATQLDKRAESYVQATNPASDWPAADYQKHKGDIWQNTSNQTIAGVEAGQSAIWNGSAWVVSAVPEDVFDRIDGKAAIYVVWNAWIVDNVSQLQTNDLFIPASDTTQGAVTYKAQKVYKWNGTSWVEINYTDDTAFETFRDGAYAQTIRDLQGQIDRKAETYVQSSDPSTGWNAADKPEHVGDMWLNTSASTVAGIASKKTAIYTKGGTDANPTYSWVQQTVPNELFDIYDGKASVFVTTPSNYKARDLWIIQEGLADSSMPAGCTVGDLAVAVNAGTTYAKTDWVKKVKYTDDSQFEDFKALYDITLADLQAAIASTQDAIARMNSDSILDETEKSYIRTEWEKINGKASLTQISEAGAYKTTINILIASGYDATCGDPSTLTFAQYLLTFNNYALVFNDRGVDALSTAFYNLRDYLTEMELYSSASHSGFDREYLATLFAAYYDAQTSVLSKAQKHYTDVVDAKVEQVKTTIGQFASDGYISPMEKRALLDMRREEQKDYTTITAKCGLYQNVSGLGPYLVNYTNAYNQLLLVMDYYTYPEVADETHTHDWSWDDNIPINTTGAYNLNDETHNAIVVYFQYKANLLAFLDSAVKDSVDAFDYLSAALGKGATTQAGAGLELLNFIGIKDSSNNIVAGMNGVSTIPDLYEDPTQVSQGRGRLMIWAGADSLADAKNATFRVWENGEINADAGKIAGWEIDEYGIKYTNNNGQIVTKLGRDSSVLVNAQIQGYVQTRCTGSGTTNYLSLAQSDGTPLIRINSAWLNPGTASTYLYLEHGTTIINETVNGWWSGLRVNAGYHLLSEVVPLNSGLLTIPSFKLYVSLNHVEEAFTVKVVLVRWTSSDTYVELYTLKNSTNLTSSQTITVPALTNYQLSSNLMQGHSVLILITGYIKNGMNTNGYVGITTDASTHGVINYTSSSATVPGVFIGANGLNITMGAQQKLQYVACGQIGSYFPGFVNGKIVTDYRNSGGQFEVSLNAGSSEQIGLRMQGYYDAMGQITTNQNTIRINFGDGNGWRKVIVDSNNYLKVQ